MSSLNCFLISCLLVLVVAVVQGNGNPPVSRKDNKDERGSFFESDMRMPILSDSSSSAAPSNLWPGKRLVYQLGSCLNYNQRQTVLTAMRDISSKTCITFQPRTTELDYVYITRVGGSACFSYVGKFGGRQILNIVHTSSSDTCITNGIVQHELLHALGFGHEHSRSDRDTYVDIQLQNIKQNGAYNFLKNTKPVDTPYDYGSVMHYSAYAFAIDTSRPTIIPKQNQKIGQRIGISSIDQLKLNKLYSCDSSINSVSAS